MSTMFVHVNFYFPDIPDHLLFQLLLFNKKKYSEEFYQIWDDTY